MSRGLVLSLVLSVMVGAAQGQDTWYVDDGNCPGPGDGSAGDPFCTIQAGIDAAIAGNTVIVADGTYTGQGNRDLDTDGKAITVRSAGGREHCTIDCEGAGRGFYFHSNEPPDTVVEGFTIRDGEADQGGVIHSTESSPTIVNCTIRDGRAGWGGGISSIGGSLTIRNCAILENRSNRGGGIHLSGGVTTITDCFIAGNFNHTADTFSYVSGGAIRMRDGAHVTIANCTIAGNKTNGFSGRHAFGGGIACEDSTLLIVNCSITANDASTSFPYASSGGGILCSSGDVTIVNSTIVSNRVGRYGGGVICYGPTTISNSTIVANVAGRVAAFTAA